MEEVKYQQLLTGNSEQKEIVADPGKGKMLIIALDRSGSMSGSPFNALKEACKLIGKAIDEPDKKPFEHFVALAYDDRLEEHKYSDV
jgi:hypothetical protein